MKSFIPHSCIVFFLLFSSCSKQIDTVSCILDEPEQEYYIEKGDFVLSPEDAEKVALCASRTGCVTKSAGRVVDRIIPINDDEGLSVMYAVLYQGGGYTLVSASKDYYPILAESEQGNFEVDCDRTGLSIMIDEYKAGIDIAKTLPRDSILYLKRLWTPYEKSSIVLPPTKSPIAQVVMESLAEWHADGYDVMWLADGCPEGLPESVYEEFCSTAEMEENGYDYMQYSFIIHREFQETVTKGPLLSTSWSQDDGFSPSDGLVGCTAVAVGQVMRYHMYPAGFPWASMHNSTATVATRDFLTQLRDELSWWFLPSNTSDPYSASSVLGKHGYHATWDLDANATTADSDLTHNRPVLMFGAHGTSGHSWVCDGYKYMYGNGEYLLKIIAPFYTEPTYYTANSYDYPVQGWMLHHMNWGWGASYNSWCSYSNLSYNYNSLRTNVVDIRPN